MDKAATHLTPAVGVLATHDNHIGRHAQIAQGAMKANRLLGLVSDLRLDNKKIDIAMHARFPLSMRTEQDHLRVGGSSRSQAPPRFRNQRLVNRVHVEIVVATSDCSALEWQRVRG